MGRAMFPLILVWGLMIALVGSAAVFAQSQPSSAEPAEQTADTPSKPETDKPKNTNTNVKKPNKQRPKEVFKPTEEISEDAPVPFPVDI